MTLLALLPPRELGSATRSTLRFCSRLAWLCLAGLPLWSGLTLKAQSLPSPATILSTMEKVADWQLRNPCSVDLRWRQSGEAKPGHIRIGWDGTVLRRREIAAAENPAVALPADWSRLAAWAGGDVAFEGLPAAVRATWQREVGLDPSALISIKLLDEGGTRGWEMATLYHGMRALAEISAQPTYRTALKAVAAGNHWTLGPRPYHADDQTVGLLYLDFYAREKDSTMLAATQSRLDWIMQHPSTQSLDIRQGQERWNWCDALFMAPPVWLRLSRLTGDQRYLEFMDREWWAVTDYLYSREDHLFYRDAKFFERREANGARVFWSRGNAWVIASLAMIIPELPEDWPSRERYLALFREMASRLVELQPADGLWRSSLLDAASFPAPEASSSALICYALARGLNRGLLDTGSYQPVVQRTWTALQNCVGADGHVGHIQQPGAAPGEADAKSTAPYAVGAFLLAGSEVYALTAKSPAAK